ncbi:hypothetical protein PGTUg99_017156 [Puccinia graminis f. sp. tritici]|uniref:Uncharacterized protein n=1 Tax=Puccinia graminis f. sp. tritici TaxID=56615 RepID=A0A5B0MS05_PUCGR|nr:hypothetical protein PGTUg99_017156 [Puccinia graminis f. sp. tritici]
MNQRSTRRSLAPLPNSHQRKINMSNAIQNPQTHATILPSTMANETSTQPVIPSTLPSTDSQGHSNPQQSSENPDGNPKKRGLDSNDPDHPQGATETDNRRSSRL